MMRDEDIEGVLAKGRIFAVSVILASLCSRILMASIGLWVSLAVVALAWVIDGYCYFLTRPARVTMRLNFRLLMTGTVFIATAILLSYEGLRVLRVSLVHAVIGGAACALMCHVGSIVLDVAISPLFDTFRRFSEVRSCAVCGYPIIGLMGNRCPECGTIFRR